MPKREAIITKGANSDKKSYGILLPYHYFDCNLLYLDHHFSGCYHYRGVQPIDDSHLSLLGNLGETRKGCISFSKKG